MQNFVKQDNKLNFAMMLKTILSSLPRKVNVSALAQYRVTTLSFLAEKGTSVTPVVIFWFAPPFLFSL